MSCHKRDLGGSVVDIQGMIMQRCAALVRRFVIIGTSVSFEPSVVVAMTATGGDRIVVVVTMTIRGTIMSW